MGSCMKGKMVLENSKSFHSVVWDFWFELLSNKNKRDSILAFLSAKKSKATCVSTKQTWEKSPCTCQCFSSPAAARGCLRGLLILSSVRWSNGNSHSISICRNYKQSWYMFLFLVHTCSISGPFHPSVIPASTNSIIDSSPPSCGYANQTM